MAPPVMKKRLHKELLQALMRPFATREQEPWTPRRDEAYIGVLIDDLITCGTQEPYRMFTSRAEYRLLLREDNADLRLTEIGRELGCVEEQQWQLSSKKREAIEKEQSRLEKIWVRPETESAKLFTQLFGQSLEREYNALDLLRRPEVTYAALSAIEGLGPFEMDTAVSEQVEIQVKYSGYVTRQAKEIERQQRYEQTQIPFNFNYQKVSGLSSEVQEKLLKIKPNTIGQAARIPGVTPAAISLLLIYLKRAA